MTRRVALVLLTVPLFCITPVEETVVILPEVLVLYVSFTPTVSVPLISAVAFVFIVMTKPVLAVPIVNEEPFATVRSVPVLLLIVTVRLLDALLSVTFVLLVTLNFPMVCVGTEVIVL